MKKRIVPIIAMICLLLPLLTANVYAASATDGGKWGSLNWSYSKSGSIHTLTISGKGQIPDYDSSTAPYDIYKNKIQRIIIEDGVTRIGERAFAYYSLLDTIQFNGNVEEIGNYAFTGCDELSSITASGKIGSIGNYAFDGCTSLTSFPFTDMEGSIGEYAFWDCTGFHRIVLPAGVTAINNYAF